VRHFVIALDHFSDEFSSEMKGAAVGPLRTEFISRFDLDPLIKSPKFKVRMQMI